MNCPNCGAALARDSIDAGACRFCSTAIERPGPKRDGSVYVDERIVEYVTTLLAAARATTIDPDLLIRASKEEAARNKRSYVIPSDVKTVAPDVVRVDPAVLRRALDDTEVP
ncbi:MAG TPA: hypothetical protein VGH28_28870 [Polyangiaceae bacterium]|jgi:MoxR-like ATPase